jgi:hypothetical protein
MSNMVLSLCQVVIFRLRYLIDGPAPRPDPTHCAPGDPSSIHCESSRALSPLDIRYPGNLRLAFRALSFAAGIEPVQRFRAAPGFPTHSSCAFGDGRAVIVGPRELMRQPFVEPRNAVSACSGLVVMVKTA